MKRQLIRKKIVTAINWVITMVMFTSACLLDSDNWALFAAVMLVCAGYLAAFAYATTNGGKRL